VLQILKAQGGAAAAAAESTHAQAPSEPRWQMMLISQGNSRHQFFLLLKPKGDL
jgi:hypothetical protein